MARPPKSDEERARDGERRRAQEARELSAAGRQAADAGDHAEAGRLFQAAADLGRWASLGDWTRLLIKLDRVPEALDLLPAFAACGGEWVPALAQSLTYKALAAGHAAALDQALERLLADPASRPIARPLLLLTRSAASRLDDATVLLAREELADATVHRKGTPSALAILLRRVRSLSEAEELLCATLTRDLGDVRQIVEGHLAALLAQQGRIEVLAELARDSGTLVDEVDHGSLEAAMAIDFAPDLGSEEQKATARALIRTADALDRATLDILTRVRDAPSLAIVGNGPSGIGSAAGAGIDARSMIVRFNAFQLGGFEADYGSRTDLVVRTRNHDPALDAALTPGVPILLSGLGAMSGLNLPFGNRSWDVPRRLMEEGHDVGYLPAPPLAELVEVLEAVPTAGLSLVWTAAAMRGTIRRDELFGFTLTSHAGLPLRDHYYEAPSVCTRHAWNREAALLRALVEGNVRPARWTPDA